MSAFKHSFTFVKALVNSYDLVSNRVVRTSTRQSPNRGCNKLTIQWLPYRLSYRTELKSNISQVNGMILANIFYIMQCAVYVGVDIIMPYNSGPHNYMGQLRHLPHYLN